MKSVAEESIYLTYEEVLEYLDGMGYEQIVPRPREVEIGDAILTDSQLTLLVAELMEFRTLLNRTYRGDVIFQRKSDVTDWLGSLKYRYLQEIGLRYCHIPKMFQFDLYAQVFRKTI